MGVLIGGVEWREKKKCGEEGERCAFARAAGESLTSFPGGAQSYDLGDLEHVRDVGRVYEFILWCRRRERGWKMGGVRQI